MGSNINITPQPHPMCVCVCVCVVGNGYRSMVNGGGTSALSLGTHHSPYILYPPPTTVHVQCTEDQVI